MRRLLLFLFLFLGSAVLIVGSIYWLNRDTFRTVFQNREALLEGSEWVEKTYSLSGLLDYISMQPAHASLVSVVFPSSVDSVQPTPPAVVRTDPTPGTPEHHFSQVPGVLFNAQTTVPGGTLSNLFLIITYANQVVSGAIDPQQNFEMERILPFYLPQADQRARRQFKRWVQDPTSRFTLHDLVNYLVQHNDPAVADYLFFQLGEDNVQSITRELGTNSFEGPIPQFGLRMAANTKIDTDHPPGTFALNYRHTDPVQRKAFHDKAMDLARSQWNNPLEVSYRIPVSFQDQRALGNMYPALEPDSFSRLILSIWRDQLINPQVSRFCRQLLLQPVTDRLMEPHILDYASQFDERMGSLSGWSLAKDSANQNLRIQVILLHDLSPGLWFHMNSNFMIRDFHHRMLYDENLQHRSLKVLTHQAYAQPESSPESLYYSRSHP